MRADRRTPRGGTTLYGFIRLYAVVNAGDDRRGQPLVAGEGCHTLESFHAAYCMRRG